MKKPKDLFSSHAENYRLYRPVFPKEFIQGLCELANQKQKALDVGTGNGQVAAMVSEHFEKVYATDISEEQLKNAIQKNNVTYQVSRAEQTGFPNHCFDLITVGQAFHWFDFKAFFSEAARIAKPGGVLALFGYGLIRGNDNFNREMDRFYNKIHPYWDPERVYIDNAYRDIKFPFEEITLEETYVIEVVWTAGELQGYLSSWSAVKKYIAEKKADPLDDFIRRIGYTGRQVFQFPVFYRIGKII